MNQRRDAAEAAFQRELQKMREEHEVISMPKYLIPAGWKLAEAYHKDGKLVICGEPDPNGRHDCDMMGCTTMNHVIWRGTYAELEKISNEPPA